MYEMQRTLYEFTLQYCQKLVADLDDSQIAHRPAPGQNPPGWILGHLAICTDYALGIIDRTLPRTCPDAWHTQFAAASKPSETAADYPSKAELMAKLETGHQRVLEHLSRANPEILAKPHKAGVLADTPIKTLGELLAHLLSTHEAVHIGQLSYWRRATGKPALF